MKDIELTESIKDVELALDVVHKKHDEFINGHNERMAQLDDAIKRAMNNKYGVNHSVQNNEELDRLSKELDDLLK